MGSEMCIRDSRTNREWIDLRLDLSVAIDTESAVGWDVIIGVQQESQKTLHSVQCHSICKVSDSFLSFLLVLTSRPN